MKLLKSVFLACATVLGISSTLLSSCGSKDGCDTLVCQHGGTCAGGFCSCPTAFDGPQCENKITDRYIGTYAGWVQAHDGGTIQPDTVDVYVSAEPFTLSFARRSKPATVYTGLLMKESNTVAVQDIISGSSRTEVSMIIRKAAPLTDTSNICNLQIVEFTDNIKQRTIVFDGVQL